VVDEILTAIICPLKGNLKKHESQVFEISITSFDQPAILTIMLNISYKLVSQIENYERSLRNYNINKERLEGYFKIDECGNYKSVRTLNVHLNQFLFVFGLPNFHLSNRIKKLINAPILYYVF